MVKIVEYNLPIEHKSHSELVTNKCGADFRPTLKTIEQLDRLRKLMLGLPVPLDRGGNIPWGYKPHNRKKGWLEPIDECFVALVKAKKYLETCSYREVAKWVSQTTGHHISAMSLFRIMQTRHPDDRAALTRRQKRYL